MAIDEDRVDDRMATATVVPDQDDSPPRGRRVAIAGVLLVLALCGVLRHLQVEAHLPWQHHWDEATNVGVGQRMSDDLSVDPGFYDYPALVFVTQAAVLVPASLVAGYDLEDDGPVLDVQNVGVNRVEHPTLLRAMRWTTSVLPQLVTTVAAALIAWVVTRRWYACVGAALLVALSAVDIRFGTFVTPDALSGTAATLAALGAVLITRDPSRRRYIWTGAAIGLAAAAKYNAASVGVVLVVAHVLSHEHPWAERRRLVPAAIAAGGVFALVNLGGVLHPLDFFREIGSEGAHYGRGHMGNEGNSPVFNAEWLWRSFGLALPLAAASLLATTTAMRKAAVVLLSFVGTYYVFLSLFPVRFARNLLPVSGTIAAAAAIGLVVCGQRLAGASGHHRRFAGAAVTALAVVVLAIPIAGTAGALRDLGEDPWSDTNTWLADHVPAGATIVNEAYTPYLDPARFHVLSPGSRLGAVSGAQAYFVFNDVDYVVASAEMFQPYLDRPTAEPEITDVYRWLLRDECIVHEADGAGQRIVVAQVRGCGS